MGMDVDGSKQKPFNTLRDAVASIAGKANVTILLTSAHSGLTIQNFEGEQAVLSGAIPIASASSRAKWRVHNRSTNAWRLDVRGEDFGEGFGLRIGQSRCREKNKNK